MMRAVDDWQAFVADCTWFLHPDRTAQVGESRRWSRGPVEGLPVLSALLAQATVTPVRVADERFELLAWGPQARRRGWLCEPPRADSSDALHPLHRRLLSVCGGIVERFGEPDSWWLNHDEVWTVSAAELALAPVLEAYGWLWDDEGLTVPIEPSRFYPVAVEANGNLTLVHRDRGGLLLFAPDHALEGVTPLPGCPPYSLMTVDDVPDLACWLEVCAAAWSG